MTRKVARDIPLSELTLRKYEKPGKPEAREAIKKICLSLGLLQPGDSRDVMVDILQVIVEAKKPLTLSDIEHEVIANRKKHKCPLVGIAASNITRQIRRLKQMNIVEAVANKYRLTEGETLAVLFEEKILRYHLTSTIERIREYLSLIK